MAQGNGGSQTYQREDLGKPPEDEGDGEEETHVDVWGSLDRALLKV